MPVDTVRRAGVSCRRADAPQDVFTLTDWLNVGGIHAFTDTAEMIRLYPPGQLDATR